jgi:hypothetical protein
MYPNGSASTFDWDYYLCQHLALAKRASRITRPAFEFIEDQRKYFSSESVVQISEVVEV